MPKADRSPRSPRSSPSTSPTSGPRRRQIRATICQNCGCTRDDTDLWRTNKDRQQYEAEDNMLCNACGLWRNEHGNQRPSIWWSRRSRSRSKSASPATITFSPTPLPRCRLKPENFSSKKKSASKRSISKNRKVTNAQLIQETSEVEEAAFILLNLASAVESEKPMSPEVNREAASPPPPCLRPAWLFNKPPEPIRPVSPPQGFITRQTPPSALSVEKLLNPPDVKKTKSNFRDICEKCLGSFCFDSRVDDN